MRSFDLINLFSELAAEDRDSVLFALNKRHPEIAVVLAACFSARDCPTSADWLRRGGRKSGGRALSILADRPEWEPVALLVEEISEWLVKPRS